VLLDLFNTLTCGKTDPEAAIMSRYSLFLPYEAVESLVCGQRIRDGGSSASTGAGGAGASTGAGVDGAGGAGGGCTYAEYLQLIKEGLGLPDAEATTDELDDIFKTDCANITIAPVQQ
jgi:hypothetical protein